MTSRDRTAGEQVPWDGSSSAVDEIRRLLLPFAPEGTLRVVHQRLALHEQGRPAGEHQLIDAVSDVSGNLVAVPLTDLVSADLPVARALDTAIGRLRADLSAAGADGVDSIEIILDVDERQLVLLAFGVEVAPDEVSERPLPPAVHDGAHHIRYYAPTLDDLRDRVAGPEPGPLRRLAGAVRGLRDRRRRWRQSQ